ncbi:unnamed protein product [Cuscuta epithymum]|uniref:Uncharacterized protein n=1 Tax=Cuscuta epithymum TaxID=186058 RepID=A0AAV0FCV7_9ASTE|nr:unnamed protein product [Cuscuta epithymum]
MKTESEEMMSSQGGLSEDASSGGSGGGGLILKKGPWTSAEDAILVDYVTKHGEGNWNAVQKHSGLARCGKSCRLRWANHLRPDLKKGAFTPEEESLIVQLHSKMGNKWARMAAELPGRTDNEIKNYWNTRLKRRQRAGLPIYPPDIRLNSLNENKQNDDFGTFSQHPELLQNNSFEIPPVEFRSFQLNQALYPQDLLDIPASSSLLPQGGLGSSFGNNRPFLSAIHPSKRIRGSGTFFPGLSDIPYQSDENTYTQMEQSYCGFSYPYDQTMESGQQSLFPDLIHGSHAFINGNSSPSDPTCGKKMELPSFQNQMGSWGFPSSSPLPSLQPVDTLVQSPTRAAEQQPDSNSGLLDAVLLGSQSLKHTKNDSSSSGGFLIMPGDLVDDSSCPDLDDPEMERNGDPISPLSHSATSVFSGKSTSDEPQSVEKKSGDVVKQVHYKNEASNHKMFSRPDSLLNLDCFLVKADHGKDHCKFKGVFGTGLFDDLSKNCKKMGGSATSTGQGYAWDAMSTV